MSKLGRLGSADLLDSILLGAVQPQLHPRQLQILLRAVEPVVMGHPSERHQHGLVVGLLRVHVVEYCRLPLSLALVDRIRIALIETVKLLRAWSFL